MKVLCVNAAGKGDLHELRARRLSSNLDAEVTFYNVDKSVSASGASRSLWNMLCSDRWDLVYQESSGLIGGLNMVRASRSREQPFIISTGDPISGYYHVTRGPVHGTLFGLFERLLYRSCTGFIGWTPYLTGRAMTLGAKRGVTIEGAVDLQLFQPSARAEQLAVRSRYHIPPDHLVCGVIGSLNWRPRHSYCYGLELVETLKLLRRKDMTIIVVGDGTGRPILERSVPAELRSRAIFTGRVDPMEVPALLGAMDVGFITQTLDALGNFRLTTKLPEYLACGVPVAMSPVPGFFDYAARAGWALPALHPADSLFHRQCAQWLDGLCWEAVRDRASRARQVAAQSFDYNVMIDRFRLFVAAITSHVVS